ncbi:hypothetical protein LguiA_018030 [Lonicera macranthoides]
MDASEEEEPLQMEIEEEEEEQVVAVVREPPKIQRLDESVVNRIAAGEVIQRPVSAIKELVENSLDANSTSVNVVVKDGGLKLIQVSDDGHGIRYEDLPILCERHTTSKLSKFEDLQSIKSMGFRGEALASMTYVGHVTVTTITRGQLHGYRVSYRDGVMEHEPKACAAVKGTQIMIENLFYNMAARRKTLQNSADDYPKIVDMLSRFAIHHMNVGFSCRKHGAARADVHTVAVSSRLDAIRSVYGLSVARSLIKIDASDNDLSSSVFEMDGFISNSNYIAKKITMIVLKSQAISSVSLLNQEVIIEKIQSAVESKLRNSNVARTFEEQTVDSTPSSPISVSKASPINPSPPGMERIKIAKSSSEQNGTNRCTGACLLDIVRNCIYIGMADDQVLQRFAHFNAIQLSDPAPLPELIMLALREEDLDAQGNENDDLKARIAEMNTELLKQKAEMLEEYFCINIHPNGNLSRLPVILDQYTPDMDRLPEFALCLGNDVDWDNEKSCFQSIAASLGNFYAMHPPLLPNPSDDLQFYKRRIPSINPEGDENSSKARERGKGKQKGEGSNSRMDIKHEAWNHSSSEVGQGSAVLACPYHVVCVSHVHVCAYGSLTLHNLTVDIV